MTFMAGAAILEVAFCASLLAGALLPIYQSTYSNSQRFSQEPFIQGSAVFDTYELLHANTSMQACANNASCTQQLLHAINAYYGLLYSSISNGNLTEYNGNASSCSRYTYECFPKEKELICINLCS
jgi:hypothetical protein